MIKFHVQDDNFVEVRFIGGFTLGAPIDKSDFYEIAEFASKYSLSRLCELDEEECNK